MAETQNLDGLPKAEIGAPPRIAFVCAGQSPRPDMTDEIIEMTGREMTVVEYGPLDGLDEYELEMMRPGETDQHIYTRLSDGTSVTIAAGPLETRIANLCASLDGEGYDLIVVLSTLLYSDFRTYTPLLHAQRVIDAWFASLSMTECNLGVVNLLHSQGEITRQRLGSMMKIQTNCVLSDTGDHVEEVARKLKGCDIILLSSVSYSEALANRISLIAGRPVVTARRVLANALQLHLGYLGRKSETHLDGIDKRLRDAAPTLTGREREIVELAVNGHSNKEIGLKLGISHRTVEKHRSSAMNKLGVTTISGLMRFVLMVQ